MKIIGFNGSPRPEGNTAKLLAAFLDGARENGARTECFSLASLRIHPCIACGVCRNNHNVCAVNDDMQRMYDEIQEASVIMLAFPVYMWQMSAQAKAFVDRLRAFLTPDFSNVLRGRKDIVLGVTQGNPDAARFRPYIDDTGKMLEFLGFHLAGTLVAPGLRDTADITRAQGILDAARELGGKLVSRAEN